MVVEDLGNQHENVEFGVTRTARRRDRNAENMSEIQKLDRTRLPRLRKVEKEELFTEVRKVNEDVRREDERRTERRDR